MKIISAFIRFFIGLIATGLLLFAVWFFKAPIMAFYQQDVQPAVYQLKAKIEKASKESSSTTAKSAEVTKITGDRLIDNTLLLIKKGGPFPYPHKDGTTFLNREGRLPAKPRGYYREYTVPDPRYRDRGPKRIVTGGHPPVVYYYTADHYQTFKELKVK